MAGRPFLRVVPDVDDPPLLPGLEASLVDPEVRALMDDLADLRNALFAAGDMARSALPFDQAGVHVALQCAAHQLGVAQRLLSQSA